MSTIDRAAAALSLTLHALGALVVDVARRAGMVLTVDERDALPTAVPGAVKVGDLVAVYAHQRHRVATVWAVTPSKLSAVYVTPSELEVATRQGRSIFPNSITARIVDCALVEAAPAAASDAAPVIDRSGTRARLLARYRDEAAGPPTGVEVAMRCTRHGAFIVWVSPPAPAYRVSCPPACAEAGR